MMHIYLPSCWNIGFNCLPQVQATRRTGIQCTVTGWLNITVTRNPNPPVFTSTINWNVRISENFPIFTQVCPHNHYQQLKQLESPSLVIRICYHGLIKIGMCQRKLLYSFGKFGVLAGRGMDKSH